MSSNDVKMSVNAHFKSQLPFRCQILGRCLTFGRLNDGQISVDVSDEATPIVFRAAFHKWDMRRGYVINGPDERLNMQLTEDRLMKKETIRSFISFYFAQPIGLRMFIFDTSREFYSYIGRVSAIDEAVLTWDAITHWERQPSGKLKLSIACSAFRSRLGKFELQPDRVYDSSLSRCLCSSNVSDVSGCCGSHKRAGSRTIFNYYPFFKVEGFPDLML